jgi:hypothetical protein
MRQRGLPYRQIFGIAKRHRDKPFRRNIDFNDGDVGVAVNADHFSQRNRPVEEINRNSIGAIHNMKIGGDMPIAIHDKTGTAAPREVVAVPTLLIDINRHHRRAYRFVYVSEKAFNFRDKDRIRGLFGDDFAFGRKRHPRDKRQRDDRY